jgi:hypothetical protein
MLIQRLRIYQQCQKMHVNQLMCCLIKRLHPHFLFFKRITPERPHSALITLIHRLCTEKYNFHFLSYKEMYLHAIQIHMEKIHPLLSRCAQCICNGILSGSHRINRFNYIIMNYPTMLIGLFFILLEGSASKSWVKNSHEYVPQY